MYYSLFCWKKQEHCKPFFIVTPLFFCQTMAAFLFSSLAELHLHLEQGQAPCSPSEKHLQVLLVLLHHCRWWRCQEWTCLTLGVTFQRELCCQRRFMCWENFSNQPVTHHVPAEISLPCSWPAGFSKSHQPVTDGFQAWGLVLEISR